MKERERKRPPFFLSQNGSQPKIEWGMSVNKERERERERERVAFSTSREVRVSECEED